MPSTEMILLRTHNLGRLFWHPVRLTGAPLAHRGKSAQYDWPYRHARPLIVRGPWGCGLAIGWWRDHAELDISAHLAQALTLGEIDPDSAAAERLITSDAGVAGARGTRLSVTVL
jgi:hypothetical protein